MATTILNIDVEKGMKNIKKTAKKINKEVLNVSKDLVEETLESGSKWQRVFAKAMKAGTVLLEKQQDLTFNTLEGVRDYLIVGGKRTYKLLEVDYLTDQVKSTVKTATEAVETQAKETFEDAKETMSKVNVKAKKAIDEVLDVPAKSTQKVEKTIAEVTAKVEETVLIADDLKKIDGVGAKLESILNEAGIYTYKQLATTKVKELKAILATAGTRYKKYNPTTWNKQAKLAAAGKWDALKNLKAAK